MKFSLYCSTACVVAGCVLATVPLTAAPADLVPEVFTDAGALAELEREGRQLPIGGRLTVAGVELGAEAPAALLDLERFQVFSDDARIVVHGEGGDEELPAPDGAWFRGTVAGDPASRVLLAVHADGRVRGVVQSAGHAWVLVEDEDGNPTTGERGTLSAHQAALEEKAEPFTCGNEDPRFGADVGNRLLDGFFDAPAVEALTTTPYTARVAVETDFEYYQKFGDVTDATDYVADVIGFASTMYDDEIDTDLQISHLSLWTTSTDPWTQSNPSCGLYEFGRYWNDNHGGVVRTIAHFMSGKNSNGGVAWVGVLCEGGFNVNLGSSCAGLSPAIDNYGGAYGYTGGLDANFDPGNPQPVWDIIAVSHEIGHNFNSPHTHCYNGVGGSTQPVDECYNGQAGQGCYAGTQSLPCATPGAGCGTIMSYCHLHSPGLTNIAFSFGTSHPFGVLPQRVPDRMRAHVESRAAVAPVCLARIDPCTEHLVLADLTISGPESHQVCGTILAHDDLEVGNGGDLSLFAGQHVALGDGFSVVGNGTLTVGNL
jgi:hypothetical protein